MKKIKYLIFPILLLISFSVTYAIFSSSKSGSGNVSAANWLVKLETIDDEIDITGGRQNINFGLCEKFMPGNPCVLPLNIDATLTEVDTVVTLEIGEVVGATKKELDAAGVSFKISDGVNEGYSYNVGYRTKKNLNLVIDWELGNINDTNKTKADLNLSKIQNNITVPVSIIVRQALNTPRVVTFNTHVNRISNPSSIEVIEGLTISNIPTITDNEYIFEGWYTKEKGGIKLTNNTIITDDITYHAHYSNIRTITFNSYGGSNIDDIEVLSGNTINDLPTPTKFGYTFNGWYTNIVGGEQLTSSTAITADRTYYAHWVTKYYTLTFNSDGSSVSPIQVQEGESLSSSNISIPTSEKEGYTLSGWFNNSEELTINTQILSDLTYTASWTPNNYTVNFDYNGATGNNSTASKSVTYDMAYGSLPTPTKTGYTFAGWKNSSNVTINENSTVQIASNHTLTATWTANTYVVTFDYNGATGGNSTVSKTVTYDGTYGTLPTPTRTGYTFMGWNGKNKYDFGSIEDYYISRESITVNTSEKSISAIKTVNWGGDYWIKEDRYTAGIYTISAIFSGNTSPAHIIYLYDNNDNIIDNTNLSLNGFQWNSYYNGWLCQNVSSVTVNIPNTVSYWKYGSAFTGEENTFAKISNIQIEEGSSATTYEPYYVTSSTMVTQSKNHTLKAIWGVNQIPSSITFNNGVSNLGSYTISEMETNDEYATSEITITNKIIADGFVSGGYKSLDRSVIFDNAYSLDNYNNIVFDYNYMNYDGSFEILNVNFNCKTLDNQVINIGGENVVFASNGKASNSSGTVTIPISQSIKDLGNVKLIISFHFGNHHSGRIELTNIHFE